MELRTLRYLVAVAEFGSVNAAARQLHLTQPSLARQLRRLERRLGLPLLELQGGRTVLTEAGHRFLPSVRSLLVAADQTLEVAVSLGGDVVPETETAA